MCDLTVGVFEHLGIISPMGVDQKVDCTQRILRGAALKKYKAVLLECKKSERSSQEISGNSAH